MATLTKETGGLIYNEDFQESSLLWSLTPSDVDCLRFNQNEGLRILHNDNYISYTFRDEPNTNEFRNYVMLVELDHTPLTEEDIGGIIVLNNTNDFAECQTYLAKSPSNIQNYGENLDNFLDFYGDLDARYVTFSFNDDNLAGDEEFEEENEEDEEETTTVNPETGFVDTIYKYIKVVKTWLENSSQRIYQFYASHNGIKWIEVGQVTYESSSSIGFFLYSTKNQELLRKGKFIVKHMYLYDSNYISINGINILQDFEIISKFDGKTLLRSDSTPWKNMVNTKSNNVIINTTNINLPIIDSYIRIYVKGQYENTVAQYDLEGLTFGGDIFNIYYDIKIYIDNKEIEQGRPYDLGYLYKNDKKIIVIYNNEDYDLANIKIKVIAYSEYYSGEEVIGMAFYDKNKVNQNINTYQYQNELMIPKLESRVGQEIILKLNELPKQEFYSAANDYRFKILIE